jgi:serine/threonine-protein kinase
LSSTEPHDRLDSWKAIAGYLRRTERTARRWEQHEGLPVHRLSHHDRSSVYAFKSELDAWRAARSVERAATDDDDDAPGHRRRARLALAALLLAVVAGVGGYLLWRESHPPTAGLVALGVLPFTVDSPAGETAHLGPAVAESLVNHLAGAPDLRVRPFDSSLRHYRPEDEPVAIGKRMGVDAIVAGRVQAAGDDLTIKVALVDVASNAQIWGTSFATTYGDLGPLQQRIARTVWEQTLLHRHGAGYPAPEFRAAEILSTNPEAVRHYLRGLGFWRNPSSSQIRYSIERFSDAVRLDPDFAAAHASLSVAYVALTYFGEAPAAETMPLAKAHSLKALSLEAGLAGGHMALAGASHWYDFDHDAAERHFRAAMEAVPGDAGVRNWYAEFLIEMRRFDEALAANRAAAERDPGWLEADVVHGNVYLFSGRPDQAIAIYREALEADSNHGLSRYFLGQAYLATHRHAEAVTELERANQAMGEAPFSMAALAHGLARAGRRAEAEKMLNDFERRRADSHYPAFAIAMAHAGLGNYEQALEWLERAADERLMGYYLPSVEPAWDPLRRQARFQRLMLRLRLPQ